MANFYPISYSSDQNALFSEGIITFKQILLENDGGCAESVWLPESQHNEMTVDWAQTLGEAGKYKGIYTKLLVFHVANMRKTVCE